MIDYLLRRGALLAVKKAATILKRPDAGLMVADVMRQLADGISNAEDHDFRGAPRTKEWVESHGQPVFSKDAEFINKLIKWTCDLERETLPKE